VSVAGVFCCAALLAVFSGCGNGGEKATQVQGKITYQSKPATNGVIAFLKEGSKPISAAIQSDGAYSIQLPPGEYKVRIDAPPAMPEGWREGQPMPQLGPRSVPDKFANFSNSGLTATISTQSPQQLDFPLK
jgi:hypothetical protein